MSQESTREKTGRSFRNFTPDPRIHSESGEYHVKTGTGCRELVQVYTRPSGSGTFSVEKSQNCRVRVREVYRTYRSRSGTVWRSHRKPYPQPGIFITTVPVPPVTLRESYRTHSTIGYGYGGFIEFTELSGTGTK